MNIIQIAAILYLAIYIFVIIGFRTYLLFHRTGINALKSRKNSGTEGILTKLFALCFVLMVVVVANFTFIEHNYKFLIPIEMLETNAIAYSGMALGIIGLLIGFIAQLQMGNSWRIAFNENESTKLIEHGLYAYSRNPIYLAYNISIIGFFMMMPNLISLGLLVIGIVGVNVKIRLEESYLLKTKGEEFLNYSNQVRRWI